MQRCVETGVKGRGKRDCAVRCRGVLLLFVLVNVVPERFCAESKPRNAKIKGDERRQRCKTKRETERQRDRETETERERV